VSIELHATAAGLWAIAKRQPFAILHGSLFSPEVRMAKRSNAGAVVRRWPVGAEIVPRGGTHFRVWAPQRQRVEVVLEGCPEESGGGKAVDVPLHAEGNGYFSGVLPQAAAGSCYRFRLDDDQRLLPDPASRFQPNGPFGPSMVVDPETFAWSDSAWPGVVLDNQIVYELHIGTFTPEGTWVAAANDLPRLQELGITLIELMPVPDFPGRFGWSYDGVNLFAPTRLYGAPDDFRRFVDRAHGLGIGVLLDVVYNHLGPNGNFLSEFSPHYFSRRYRTEWGDALNFDAEESFPVREFILANAAFWIAEYHLDGLRIDATQQIFDSSEEHMIAAIGRCVRQAAGDRKTVLIAENEPQQTQLIRPPDEGGYGLDALWNDDFHHSAMVALTGRNEAYYSDYLATPQEFVSLARFGFLYQGQRYKWQGKRRGSPTFGLPRQAFVNYLQNHDQIANSGQGQRAHQLTSPGNYRAMTAFLLLAPGTPMLFQGQEYAAGTPFFYFADHPEEIALLIHHGRTEFLRQFRSLAVPEIQARLPDPADPVTFVSCKLDPLDRQRQAHVHRMHRDLLQLRRQDAVFRRACVVPVEGAVLGESAFLLRYFGDREDRLLIVNFGRDLHLDPAPEPLLAPMPGREWTILWSSEDPLYRGNGTAPLETEANWIVPGQAAVVLRPAN
jgi:maltooligosyltrehalose trehalohydrolase